MAVNRVQQILIDTSSPNGHELSLTEVLERARLSILDAREKPTTDAAEVSGEGARRLHLRA
jgi:hypothetical protein